MNSLNTVEEIIGFIDMLRYVKGFVANTVEKQHWKARYLIETCLNKEKATVFMAKAFKYSSVSLYNHKDATVSKLKRFVYSSLSQNELQNRISPCYSARDGA